MSMSDFKYWVADRFFGKELDEAYEMGIRIGAEYVYRKLHFTVQLKEDNMTATKTQKVGYNAAQIVIESCKEEIEHTTGVYLP